MVFYDTTIQLGVTQDPEQVLTPDVMQGILCELWPTSFQFELLSLVALLRDILHYGHEGLTQAAAESSSSEQLLRIFPMLENVRGSFMINKIPNHDFSLTSFDLGRVAQI